MRRVRTGRRRTEWAISLALAGTFLVLAGLWIQGFRSVRAHRAMVDATLSDYAAFAAERIAGSLDQVFAAIFLDQIGLARAIHYDAQAGETSERPESRPRLPTGAVPVFFSWTEEALHLHGPGVPELGPWIDQQVQQHRPGYPRPAPYVVLRGREPHALVYRREYDYDADREAVFGFVVDLRAFAQWLQPVLSEAELLPRSLSVDADPTRLLHTAIHLHPEMEALLDWGRADAEGPREWAFARKGARLAVGVTVDVEEAAPLTAGGARAASLPGLGALGVLTLALLGVSVRLMRRASRLHTMREQFVANVSHDLRTPIAQIRLFSESLLAGRLEAPADRERALGVIHRQTEVLSDLVSNVLHASEDRPSLGVVEADLEPLVRSVCDALEPLAHGRGARIDVRWPEGRSGSVDPLAFQRVLTNLVENALRHADGVKNVLVEVRASSPHVTLVVDDDGGGIPRGREDDVFERFTRLDAEGRSTGAGLGLAVVRDLARRHGGDAWVERVDRPGARFVVRFGPPAAATS